MSAEKPRHVNEKAINRPEGRRGATVGQWSCGGRAVSFTEELLDRCEALADNPRAYALVACYERFGIRRCVHGDYLSFYRLRQEVIEVIHILQGAWDVVVRSPSAPGRSPN